jgi:iron complex outermembrane receptor protein
MSSMMAAAAIGAMMTGAGVARSPARAAISPQERSGAIQIYRIPAGSMAAALNVIADENDLHVLYDARLTDGLTTAGLSGAYSVRDALGSLLSGTRLSYEFSRDGHSVSIVLAQADTMRNDAGAEALPPIDIGAEEKARDERNGRPIDASRLRLEPKTPTEAYVVRSAETATKTDTPVKDIPASIQVVPKQILTDQQVTNLSQAVDNVSGVHANNFDGITSLFYMRGFKTNYIFRNSLPLPQLDGTPQLVDTAYVERIEVLKGPSSILYGRTEPGGLINIVTKQPLDQPLYRVDQQIGSYDHYRTQWDFSAPVKEIPGLAYRISGAYQDNGSFRQFNPSYS